MKDYLPYPEHNVRLSDFAVKQWHQEIHAKLATLLLSNFSNWFFKNFAKMIRAANSTYLVQSATMSRSQIYQGEFLKFTGMLYILESNILQCIFSVLKLL